MNTHWIHKKREIYPETRERWDRVDNACVINSPDTYYSNPMNPRHRPWIAFPHDKDTYFGFFRKNSIFRFPRRFKTAEAAIKFVDKEDPFTD